MEAAGPTMNTEGQIAKRKKALVFTGTSISHTDAKKILDAEYRPPVSRGDLEDVRSCDIIGIIDGVFFSKAAVAHKEILRIMASGITVVGGGSMGALRASELDRHGMIGVGKIYECYKNGTIEDDDEVAVATNPDTFEPVSNPMVNIRATLHSAAVAGIIDEASCKELIYIAKQMHYPERSYLGLTKEATRKGILSYEVASVLLDHCKKHETDIKKQDAVLVLEKIKGLLE